VMSWARWTPCVLLLVAASACTDAVPTSSDRSQIPVDAETVEVELPFSAFAEDFRAYAGFASPSDLFEPLLAHEWEGALESRALLRFGPLPDLVNVAPPGGGASQPDSFYVPVSGTVVIKFDTLQILGPASFHVEAGAIQNEWDPDTATWDLATDTLGGREPWPEAGAGPVRPIGEGTWTPFVEEESSAVDSLRIEVDSVTVTEWADSERTDVGLRIGTTTPESHIRVIGANLLVHVRSTINPDTLVDVSPLGGQSTFVYSPGPVEAPGVMQIGGAPARRGVFRIALPEAIDPSGDVCLRIECPLRLEPNRLVYAALDLRTHESVSAGLSPVDTLAVELRPVLSPSRLPRSPLGSRLHAQMDTLPPEVFSSQTETLVEIGMTDYVQNLLQPDSLLVGERTPTIAIVSSPEPRDIGLASFYAPGTEQGPTLRLILTVSDKVPLP
jgi:hypothetical protein